MNRRVLLLNLGLLVLAGALGWLLRIRWIEVKQHERETFARAVQKRVIPPPLLVQPPKPVSPAEYFDVAQKTLFSRDRTPNVVVEVKAPPPKPPVPPLPLYYGQLGLSGDPTIFLAQNGGVQKTYHAGDKLDKFKLLAFNHETITLQFNDETIEKRLDDLKPKEQAPPQQAAYSAPAAAAAPTAAQPVSRSLASAPGAVDSSPDNKNPTLGADFGSGFRGAVAGDTSPAGTVLDGFKKVCTHTMMGQDCHWEQVK